MAQTRLGFFNMGDAERIADPWEAERARQVQLELERRRVEEAIAARVAQNNLSRQQLAARQQESMAKLGLDRDRLAFDREDMSRKQANERRRLEQVDLAREQRERMSGADHDRALELLGLQRGQQLEDRGALWGREDVLRAEAQQRADDLRGEKRRNKLEDRASLWEREDVVGDRKHGWAKELQNMGSEAAMARTQAQIEEQRRSSKVQAEGAKEDRAERKRANLAREEAARKRAEVDQSRYDDAQRTQKAESDRARMIEGQNAYFKAMEVWKDKGRPPTQQEVAAIKDLMVAMTPEQQEFVRRTINERLNIRRLMEGATMGRTDDYRLRQEYTKAAREGLSQQSGLDAFLDAGLGFGALYDELFGGRTSPYGRRKGYEQAQGQFGWAPGPSGF